MSARQKTGHDPRKTCLRCCHQRHCLPNTPGARGCGPRLVLEAAPQKPNVFPLYDVKHPRRTRSEHSTKALSDFRTNGGARRDRTDDLLNANQALSQLSYGPFWGSPIRATRRGGRSALPQAARSPRSRPSRSMVGLGRLERPTSPLSGVRSNHLSYRP
jgi:hypothetical protein